MSKNSTRVLIIHNVTKEDSGNYSCKAQNRLGEIRRYTFLEVNSEIKLGIHSIINSTVRETTIKEHNNTSNYSLILLLSTVFIAIMSTNTYRKIKRIKVNLNLK